MAVVFRRVSPHKSCQFSLSMLAVMAEILKPDVCIIGAGALGVNLAISARQRGLATVLVERGDGEAGDPLHGSLHRAALSASTAQAQAIRTGARLGLDNAPPKLNYKGIAEHARNLAAASAPATSPERLSALGVVMLKGEPRLGEKNVFRIGETTIRPGHYILATGSSPLMPDLPGLADIDYFTPDTILDNTRKLTHLLVIGGNETAVELAQIYRRLGSDVTLVPQGPLLAGYDAEMTAILLRHLREEGVAIVEGARVKAFLPRSQGIGVTLNNTDGHVSSLDISHVLVASGRVPVLDWAWLDKLKIKRQANQPDRLHLNEHGRTSSFRISAFGGAAGEDNLHVALRKGERLLNRLAGRPAAASRLALPAQLATQPAMAQIGSFGTAESLKAGQTILRANLGENEAARAIGLAQGSAKILIDRNGMILAGAMVGEGAGEVIASLALAIQKGVTAGELASLPLTGTSALAILVDLGNQFASHQRVSDWSKRRASLHRFLP
jgi:pyruvate/2-oxoglutarate dehydrogenase complex dihydrolipoamide dehydrogenase (E3) component